MSASAAAAIAPVPSAAVATNSSDAAAAAAAATAKGAPAPVAAAQRDSAAIASASSAATAAAADGKSAPAPAPSAIATAPAPAAAAAAGAGAGAAAAAAAGDDGSEDEAEDGAAEEAEAKPKRVPEPVDPKRTFTKAQLWAYNGRDPTKPLYISLKGQVYDVSSAEHFYGPKGGYAQLSGRESSRVLGAMDFSQLEYTGWADESLDDTERETLNDWVAKFDSKYPRVGTYVVTEQDVPPPKRDPNQPALGPDGKPKDECALM